MKIELIHELKEEAHKMLSGEIEEHDALSVYTFLVSFLSNIETHDDMMNIIKLFILDKELKSIDSEYRLYVEANSHTIVAEKKEHVIVSDLLLSVAKVISVDDDEAQPLIDAFTDKHKEEILTIISEIEERFLCPDLTKY